MHLLFPDMSWVIIIPDHISATFSLPVFSNLDLRVHYSNHPLATISCLLTQLNIVLYMLQITQNKNKAIRENLYVTLTFGCDLVFALPFTIKYLLRVTYPFCNSSLWIVLRPTTVWLPSSRIPVLPPPLPTSEYTAFHWLPCQKPVVASVLPSSPSVTKFCWRTMMYHKLTTIEFILCSRPRAKCFLLHPHNTLWSTQSYYYSHFIHMKSITRGDRLGQDPSTS